MALVRFEPSRSRYAADDPPVRTGFDPDGPWQMVPYKGERFLHLHLAGVKSWSVESVNPSIATVSAVEQYGGVDQNQNNVCRVKGLRHGRTFLIVRGPKREELGRIEIEVKHRLKRFIRFFLVSDNAGHQTSFTKDDTEAWTKFINEEVFRPQINVDFQHLMTGRITIPEDLGDRIDFSSLSPMPHVGRDGGGEPDLAHDHRFPGHAPSRGLERLLRVGLRKPVQRRGRSCRIRRRRRASPSTRCRNPASTTTCAC